MLQSIYKAIKNISDYRNIKYRREKNIQMLPHELLSRTNNKDNKSLVMLNDNKTHLEYVVQILYYSFCLSWKKELLLAVEVNESHSSVIGGYDNVSGKKIIEIIHLNARKNGYPLQLEQKIFNKALQLIHKSGAPIVAPFCSHLSLIVRHKR